MGLSMLLYVIGIPLAMRYLLHKYRDALYDPSHPQYKTTEQLQLRTVCGAYKKEFYYFELVDMCRKVILTGVMVVLSAGSTGHILLGIIISLFYFALVTHYKPYTHAINNQAAMITSMQLLLTLVCGMALDLQKKSAIVEGTLDAYNDSVIGVLIVGMNACTLIVGVGVMLVIILPGLKRIFMAECGHHFKRFGGLKERWMQQRNNNCKNPLQEPSTSGTVALSQPNVAIKVTL